MFNNTFNIDLQTDLIENYLLLPIKLLQDTVTKIKQRKNLQKTIALMMIPPVKNIPKAA